MDITAAKTAARNVMRLHGFDVPVRISTTATRWAGATKFAPGSTTEVVELALAAKYIERSDRPAVKDTIRHEVAHMIAGLAAGHGPAWQAACKKTGAVPTPCVDVVAIQTRTRRNREHYARQAQKEQAR